MPYANNNGVKVYYEVEGQGPPLVLGHPGAGSLNLWRTRGYVDALRNDYQLILFDARGHGQSDKPHEVSAYGTNMADDVVALLDSLGIGKAHYFGYSMGAWIGLMLATRHVERFRSFIIGGWSPYHEEPVAKEDRAGLEMMKLVLSDPEYAVRQREKNLGRLLTDGEKNRMLTNDAAAAVALLTSDIAPFTDSELARISVPCLLFCGDVDSRHTGAKESINHMPQARFISLPSLDHATAFARSELMLPHIKEFLAEVSKK